jgi:hypothetical protein
MNKLDLAKITTDPVILDELSKDKNWYVRSYVVKNPNTTPETIDYLSKDEDPDVRWCVARNPNTTPETLDYLSRDKDSDVRCRVARNPNTSLETLKQMFIFEAESGCDDTVKVYIVDNPKFITMIKDLCLVPVPEVSTGLTDHP